MATTFKTFLNNDVISSRTLLHEAIPLTGTIVSGSAYSDNNIKNYSHGMFQSVFDYPYLSSSSNHVFDITCGFASDSTMSGTAGTPSQQAKKINIYNQMAQVLMGYDSSGNIRVFDQDGDFTGAGGTKYRECIFINFSRLLVKDEIKKGTFKMEFGVKETWSVAGGPDTTFSERIKITDVGAADSYKINSPVGEYGILIADSTAGTMLTNDVGTLAAGQKAGLIFYQAGVAVIPVSLFLESSHTQVHNTAPSNVASGITGLLAGGQLANNVRFNSVDTTASDLDVMMISSSIQTICDGVRNRIYNVEFNNTTELNSTIYFCRINNNDYNYSSNPTYLSDSQIVVKKTHSDEPITYMTTVGLYSASNELLAVAKLSEPLKKTPSNEFTLRVRLDY